MSVAVADVLEKAALILERDGWVRGGSVVLGVGPCCLVQAVNRAICAVETPPARLNLWEDSQRALRKQIGGRGVHQRGAQFRSRWVARWNDREGRTEAEVLAVLRGAAATEREAA